MFCLSLWVISFFFFFIHLTSVSISSVLVSPTSLNTPGILLPLVLPGGGEELLSGWTPLDYNRGGEGWWLLSTVFCYFTIPSGIPPPRGTHQGTTKYLQRHTFLNPHRSHYLYPAETDLKYSWHGGPAGTAGRVR